MTQTRRPRSLQMDTRKHKSIIVLHSQVSANNENSTKQREISLADQETTSASQSQPDNKTVSVYS